MNVLIVAITVQQEKQNPMQLPSRQGTNGFDSKWHEIDGVTKLL